MMRAGFLLICAAIFSSQATAVELNDAVLEEGANGTAVVLLSVAHIQEALIFPDDNGILRRIAYVETRDGRDLNNGGIWAVNNAAFMRTKDTRNTLLALKYAQIRQEFNIVWRNVQLSDLRRPFYSALAARLVLFIAPRAIPSDTDVVAQAQFWRENYNTNGNVDDFIGATRELQGAIIENSASDFYIGFARNDADGPDSPNQLLFITTREIDPVPFTVRNPLGFYFTGIATRNSTTVVPLGNAYQVFNSNDRNKGFHVSAGDKQIVVYGLNYDQFTSDAFLALPCSRLTVDQYEYYAITYHAFRVSQLLFVGCEDNTTINFASTTITLNQMETYLYERRADITGTRVVSNKPISFFPGHQCTNIPTNVAACDHITEQFPPTAIWGSNFLSASFENRSSGEIYRILASESSTTVSVNCTNTQPVSYSLTTAGSWQQFSTPDNSFCVIESNKPLLVVEFGLAHNLDGVGDPFMMMIPPIEQYSNDYVFNVLSNFSTNHITMFVSPENFKPDQIFLDETSQEQTNWTPIYCLDRSVCGYAAYASLKAGEHRLSHSDTSATIGVSAYGFNLFNSYGYPGGLQLAPITLATVSFSQETYQIRENEMILKVSVVRSGNTESQVVVLIANHPSTGSATAGQDYSTVIEILEFQPGVTENEVEIRIIDDESTERNENFLLYLSSGAGVFLSPFAETEVTIIDNDGIIQLSPSYGNQLGGTPVIVSGTNVMFREGDDITCIFKDQRVNGVYIKQEQALCVSPELSETGIIPFQLVVNQGNTSFTGETTYISLPFAKAFEVYVESDEPVIESGTAVTVYWSPQSIFTLADAESYTVDITLRELDMNTNKKNVLITLASDLPNNGEARIKIPELKSVENYEDSLSPVVIEVGVSHASMTSKKRSLSSVLSAVGRFGLRILKQAPMRIAKKLIRQVAQRLGCEAWALTQSSELGQQINDRLPPCPCTAERAGSPNSGFKEEKLSSIVKVIGRVQDFFDTAIVDDAFRNYFHRGASSCYRQRVTNPSLTGGSGQQCCYDANGDIIVGSPGGGTVDIVSPDVSTLDHFIRDVIPFWLCCKAGFFSNCGRYYRSRPSDDCSRSIPPPLPAVARGDPHLVTLDGYQYTFNGRGEFVLIETSDGSFTLQGRMVDVEDVNGTLAPATVFSALVAREGDSDIVQFEAAKNDSVIALVNGERVDFNIVEQEFKNVTVADLGNNTLSATFSSGAYIEVQQENGILSSVIVSLPESFKSAKTQGLLGSFNGDTSDDLVPKLSSTPLSLDSSSEEIHKAFGLTWIIDTPSESMFYYQPQESWATYYDPFFEPAYEPVFDSPDLEKEAIKQCEGDRFCLFDVAATRNIDLGLITLRSSQQLEEIVNHSVPIVCDPPCENGACVANNTCACSEGFSGDTCDTIIMMECEGNPCENGGTCTRHVDDYTCTCPPGFSGSLCEGAAIRVNDTVVGDPLFTVPIFVPDEDSQALVGSSRPNLCYEVHGEGSKYFSLVTDECTSVNAHYFAVSNFLNVINHIGIRAVDTGGICKNILIDVNNCSVSVDGMPVSRMYQAGGITVSRIASIGRVRVTVPNCNELALVMRIDCLTRVLKDPFDSDLKVEAELIHFEILRGLNFGHRAAHGLLGQFWNVPFSIEEYNGLLRDGTQESGIFVLNFTRLTDTTATAFTGYLGPTTWETRREPCLYVGNRQGAEAYEVEDPNDPVIQGFYTEYEVDGPFSTHFMYSLFNETMCV